MLGLNKQLERRNYHRFSEQEQRMIIEDYLASDLSKKQIWEKYIGNKSEHGQILYWMYKYGYDEISFAEMTLCHPTVKIAQFLKKSFFSNC